MVERHSLNHDPYARPASERDYGTKHPSRFEPKQQTIGSTQPQQRARARVHHSTATQSIADDGTFQVVTFNTTTGLSFDTIGLLASNGFTIPATGKITGAWWIHGQITWAAAAAGVRELRIRKNGTTTIAHALLAGQNNEQSVNILSLVNDPNALDSFKLEVKQTSGGALNLIKDPEKTFFEIIHEW